MTFNQEDTMQLRPCALCGKMECVYKILCASCYARLYGNRALERALFRDALVESTQDEVTQPTEQVVYKDDRLEIRASNPVQQHRPQCDCTVCQLKRLRQYHERLQDEVDDILAQVKCVRVPEPEPVKHEIRFDCDCEACKRGRFNEWQFERWAGGEP